MMNWNPSLPAAATPAQQKNYRSNVVQAIKVFDPDHPAIALVSLSTEQYRILNDQQRERLAARRTRYITSETAEEIVHRATQLIQSSAWSEVGAGLAVLIGRQISEILLSTISQPSTQSSKTEIAEPEPKRVGIAAPKEHRSETVDKIADVIDAIIKWNTAQERSDLRLRISFPSVRSLAVLVGASYLPAIKEVMEEKQSAN